MVVQHNLRAMNSNRMLGLTASVQSKSTEKLSSGYKINRAADDAAGLSISEKMRKQIRGLSQASLNAADGISAVQTAEGALNEVKDMLQRMNELAVKAANGTMSEDDRGYIQDEIDQLVTEIDRVAETTKFNETYLLKGVEGKETTEEKQITQEMTADYAITIEKNVDRKPNVAFNEEWYEAGSDTPMAIDDIQDLLEVDENGDVQFQAGKALYKQASETGEFGAQTTLVTATDLETYFQASTTALLDENGQEVAADDLKEHFNSDGSYKGTLYKRLTADVTGGTNDGKTAGTLVKVGAEQIDNYVTVTPETVNTVQMQDQTVIKALSFKLHVGADATSNNQITIDINAMDADSLGLKTGVNDKGVRTLLVDGKDDKNALKAIDTIKEAIQSISTQRSALGAVQNRLEHTISNLDNTAENLQSAESGIRDTDMASEMVQFSKNNILQQAAQSMLAQANQANQSVLSLLG